MWWDQYGDSVNGQLVRVRLTSVDDSGQQQIVTGEGIDGQVIGEAVRLQHFGATSVPPAGAEGLMLTSGGRHDRAHFLGLEHPDYKPVNLPGGAKAIYDAGGNIIKLIGADGAVFDFTGHNWTVKFKGGLFTTDGKDFYFDAPGANINLGGKQGDNFSPVVTVAGPAKNVFAVPA